MLLKGRWGWGRHYLDDLMRELIVRYDLKDGKMILEQKEEVFTFLL
jgi:hypothetical protein